jgi:hypothetical protein
MKLRVYVLPRLRAAQELRRDAQLAAAFDLSGPAFWADPLEPAFERLFEVARGTDGLWLRPHFEFSARELAAAPRLQVRPTSIVNSRELADRNLAALRATPLREAGAFAGVRVLRGLALKRANLKPNQVGCVDDWLLEYVAGSEVLRVLQEAAFTGWEAVPVDDGQGRPLSGITQLYCAHLLPPSERNATAETVADEGGLRVQQTGCLTYRAADLEGQPDCARSAEPFEANDVPSWTVSPRLARLFRERALKGWAFRPVLVAGTPLALEYDSRWQRVQALHARGGRS